MNTPCCENERLKIIETRKTPYGKRSRAECKSCGYRESLVRIKATEYEELSKKVILLEKKVEEYSRMEAHYNKLRELFKRMKHD